MQHVLVQRSRWDEVCERYLEAMAAVPTGDPHAAATVCGPLIDARACTRVAAWMEQAERAGGRRLAGGERKGAVISPVVYTDVAAYGTRAYFTEQGAVRTVR